MTGLWWLQAAAERIARAKEGLDTPLPERLIGLVGVAVMLGIAYLMSNNRKRIDWRMVGVGVALQIVLGMAVLWTAPGMWLFSFADRVTTG